MISFALYRNVPSLISSLIRWQTRSVYSHVAIVAGGSTYEALSRGFVRASSLGENHDAGVIVDILEYKQKLAPTEEIRALQCLDSMVGAKYDFEMVLAGFPFRYRFEPRRAARKIFCSEAALIVSAAMGPDRILLERVHPSEVSPEDINTSALLKWKDTVTL